MPRMVNGQELVGSLNEQKGVVKARFEAVTREQESIRSTAQQAGGLTDEQREKLLALGTEAEELVAIAEGLIGDEKLLANESPKLPGLDLNPTSPTENGPKILNNGPLDEKPKNTHPRVKMIRRGSLHSFRGERNGMSADERAYRFGMWCVARMDADLPGKLRSNLPRWAREYCQSQGLWENTTGTTDGSTNADVLVPLEFGTDIIDLREEYGVVRTLFKNVNMSSDQRTDPRRVSGPTAYFVGENAAGTESDKKWNDVRLVAKDLMCITRYSNQVSADAIISLGDDLVREISYAFSVKEDECGINGDQTSTYGGIQGLRPALTAATASLVTGASGTDDDWSLFTMANFSAMIGKLPDYADSPRTAWLCHRAFFYEVMEDLQADAGGNTGEMIRSGFGNRPRPMFRGYPVIFAQPMPKVGTTGTGEIVCTLGDYTLAASFGDRQQEAISFSEHASVSGQSLWERNQIGIRGTQRFDINVHDVGDTTDAGAVVGLLSAA